MPEPEPEPEPELVIFNKDMVDFSYNSGYGYTRSFASEWGGFLPPTLSVYTSSGPAVVQINDQGEFTTLLPGTAVLTAVDPNVPEVAYTLTVSVQDHFNWSFQLPDVQLDMGQSRIVTVDSWAFDRPPGHEIVVEQVEWTLRWPRWWIYLVR